jgi:hypothetical protein
MKCENCGHEEPEKVKPTKNRFLWAFWGIGLLFCAATVLVGLGYSIRARILNPDLSETRLFVKCWLAYLLMIVGGLSSMVFLNDKPLDKP